MEAKESGGSVVEAETTVVSFDLPPSHSTTAPLRRPSLLPPSPRPPPRARSASVKDKAPPAYLQSILAYSDSLTTPPVTPFISTFMQSSVYSLSPHELALLFQGYSGNAGAQGVGVAEFSALVTDYLRSVTAGLEEKGLGELAAKVMEWVGEGEGGVEGWVSRLFSAMDRRGVGRVENEEFGAFLPLVDEKIGERLRREWKRSVVVPKLMELALL